MQNSSINADGEWSNGEVRDDVYLFSFVSCLRDSTSWNIREQTSSEVRIDRTEYASIPLLV